MAESGSPDAFVQQCGAVARTLIRAARMLERIDTGLTMPQYRLLSLLNAGDERSTALAQRLAVSKPAISAAVEALVGLGHLRRKADDGDRRITWLQLTKSGAAALRAADEAYTERLSSVLGRMDHEHDFLEAVAQFALALDQDRDERRAAKQMTQAERDGAAVAAGASQIMPEGAARE